jgi:hypothetical protein
MPCKVDSTREAERCFAPIMLAMDDQHEAQLRRQYVILWRYGALAPVLVGLAMLGFGASGMQGEPISVTFISLGFLSVVAGVVLPRIEGKFSAGGSGVAAELLAVHKIDFLRYNASAPVLRELSATETRVAIESGHPPNPIKPGDVSDALEANGYKVTSAATGKRNLEGPHGHREAQVAAQNWRLRCKVLLGFGPCQGSVT